jgi:hypothetical protein
MIEDAISLDDFGIGIREHRIVDFVAVGEEFEDFLGVVADGRELDALLFKPGERALQLDQLPFAKGSPVGGTEEEKNRAVWTFQRFERLHVAEFVASGKIGSFLADGEADGHEFSGRDLDGVFVEGTADGDGVAEVCGDFVLRLERVHQAVGVVVESDFGAGYVFEALGGFVEGFVGIAGAGDENAGPGAGLRCRVLAGKSGGDGGGNYTRTEEKALCDQIDFNFGHRFLLLNQL